MGVRSCLFFILLLACACTPEEFDVKNPDVDQFVRLLKNGSYEQKVGYQLPDFDVKHLEKLLQYVGDTASIHMFPGNPISSKHTNPKILNECLMWTIDGVRLENKYPSLEAVLIDTSTYSALTGYPRISGKKLIEIGNWYKDWYQTYRANPSIELRKKNLFEQTTYQWN
ncbi:MAG: DUF4943 family protein [Cyclobacteriaceae bacterium]|nr:DUF4943 family protein [Cyclobacteriaceae bacterium]